MTSPKSKVSWTKWKKPTGHPEQNIVFSHKARAKFEPTAVRDHKRLESSACSRSAMVSLRLTEKNEVCIGFFKDMVYLYVACLDVGYLPY